MLATAKQAALAAGEILEKYFNKLTTFEHKNAAGTDWVSVADKEAEEKIKKIVLDKFPAHGFWGEETGQEKIKSDYIWVVDPLDGTSNFILNIPLYAVSIALMYRGEVILGVAYIPRTQELFWAKKGRGAFCNDIKINVSSTQEVSQAIAAVEYWSKGDSHIDQGLHDFTTFARQVKKMRYLSSTVFELCRVAKGNLDFCCLDTTFLDIAAAQLIVEEAGGWCRLYNGDPIIPSLEKKVMRIKVANPTLFKLL